MNYDHIDLYVMSGTGNSRRVAVWLSEYYAGQQGPASRILRIERGSRPLPSPSAGKSLIGIITPTHAFTAPWPVFRLVWRLPPGKSTDAFSIATRGSIQIGRWFAPGLAGSTTFLVAILLALKGYRVRGLMSVDMPANWTACYPGLSPEKAGRVIERARPRVRGYFGKILSGSPTGFTLNNLYDLIGGLLLLPISALYLPIGRFFLAKLFFANNRCNGCGFCAKNCPSRAIRMIGQERPRPYWRLRCVSCMRCMSFCPQAAIEAGHSWAIILIWIIHAPVAVGLLTWVEAKWPMLAGLNALWIRLAVQLGYLYLSLCLAYGIFYLLTRIRLVNALFTWTTFTCIYRRYHEPGTNVEDLRK